MNVSIVTCRLRAVCAGCYFSAVNYYLIMQGMKNIMSDKTVKHTRLSFVFSVGKFLDFREQ